MYIKTAALNVIFVYKMYILYVYANRLSCIPILLSTLVVFKAAAPMSSSLGFPFNVKKNKTK
jgi:hypothetical protein